MQMPTKACNPLKKENYSRYDMNVKKGYLSFYISFKLSFNIYPCPVYEGLKAFWLTRVLPIKQYVLEVQLTKNFDQ